MLQRPVDVLGEGSAMPSRSSATTYCTESSTATLRKPWHPPSLACEATTLCVCLSSPSSSKTKIYLYMVLNVCVTKHMS